MNETPCPVCGEPAEVKLVAKAFGRGESLLVIEDIPVISCRHCHERYLTAETLRRIDAVRRQPEHTSRMVKVDHCAA